jgi:hypothetical protein
MGRAAASAFETTAGLQRQKQFGERRKAAFRADFTLTGAQVSAAVHLMRYEAETSFVKFYFWKAQQRI